MSLNKEYTLLALAVIPPDPPARVAKGGVAMQDYTEISHLLQ